MFFSHTNIDIWWPVRAHQQHRDISDVSKDLGPYFNDLSARFKEHGAGAARACLNPLLLV